MSVVVMGIDPGKTGGIAVLNREREVLALLVMPVVGDELSPHKLFDVLFDLKTTHKIQKVFIEKVGVRPGQSAQSVVKTGRNYGIIEGVVASLAMAYEEVPARTWTMKLPPSKKTEGMSQAQAYKASKERNVREAIKAFPTTDFLATERSKVPHLGLIDALLIANYGLSTI